MLNLLEEYRRRSLPEWGDFSTNPNLRKKVGEAGEFLSYYGNTVLFARLYAASLDKFSLGF